MLINFIKKTNFTVFININFGNMYGGGQLSEEFTTAHFYQPSMAIKNVVQNKGKQN